MYFRISNYPEVSTLNTALEYNASWPPRSQSSKPKSSRTVLTSFFKAKITSCLRTVIKPSEDGQKENFSSACVPHVKCRCAVLLIQAFTKPDENRDIVKLLTRNSENTLIYIGQAWCVEKVEIFSSKKAKISGICQSVFINQLTWRSSDYVFPSRCSQLSFSSFVRTFL